jgi:hypothetical protein
MRVSFIPEPLLEFHAGTHIDIRYGLANLGPLDLNDNPEPRVVRVGIVGTPETVEGVRGWLERAAEGVEARLVRHPHTAPAFPGFTTESPLAARLAFDDRTERTIADSAFTALAARPRGEASEAAVELFLDELRHIAERGGVDVIVCALSQSVLDATGEAARTVADEGDEVAADQPVVPAALRRVDFRQLLKARAMEVGVPIQIIKPPTWGGGRKRGKGQLQDEATRAWNFFTALYYKSGGTLWRLVRDPHALTSCFVGVSFFRSPDDDNLRTSVAQVFNELGQGVVVRGAAAQISKDDRQPHLSQENAQRLLLHALQTYRREHRTLPARVVVHKTSKFSEQELEGMRAALDSERVSSGDFVSIFDSLTRLYRRGNYPPLRGTFLSLDDATHTLYTRGSVEFFETYPGAYVPLPLGFRCDRTVETPRFLAEELLALTKLNWNNTQFDGRDPITIRAARQVGDILKWVADDARVEPRYGFYM